LFEWKSDLQNELIEIINSFPFSAAPDAWGWGVPGKGGEYTEKLTYCLLASWTSASGSVSPARKSVFILFE
jgi:hypothetical protein